MYNKHFDPIINLKQGKEFLKYGAINKINSIRNLMITEILALNINFGAMFDKYKTRRRK